MPKFPIEETYFRIAIEVSKRSYAERMKVGSVLVSEDNNQILSFGFNGTPPRMNNSCELEDGTTDPLVLHAETAAILKCAREGRATENSILYLTLSPCMECCKIILQAGIKAVYYLEEYRIKDGIDFLNDYGIPCIQYDLEEE